MEDSKHICLFFFSFIAILPIYKQVLSGNTTWPCLHVSSPTVKATQLMSQLAYDPVPFVLFSRVAISFLVH